jgi:hypothetical protein
MNVLRQGSANENHRNDLHMGRGVDDPIYSGDGRHCDIQWIACPTLDAQLTGGVVQRRNEISVTLFTRASTKPAICLKPVLTVGLKAARQKQDNHNDDD